MISVKYTATEGVNLLGSEVGAWLFDTVAETVTAVELVTNGGFPVDTTGWTALGSATLAVISAELRVTSTGVASPGASQVVSGLTIGKMYVISSLARRGTCVQNVTIDIQGIAASLSSSSSTSNVTIFNKFIATATSHTISVYVNGAAAVGETAFFDNISCVIGDDDLSTTDKAMRYHGTIIKSPVAVGAGTMGYSGFSTSSYLSRAYGADLDITSQATVMGWIKPSAFSAIHAICGNYNGVSGDFGGCLLLANATNLKFLTNNNAGSLVEALTSTVALNVWTFVVGTMTASGLLSVYKNGGLSASQVGGVIGATNTRFSVGINHHSGVPANPFVGNITGVRVINTALTASQIRTIYDREKSLFIANAPYRVVGTQYGLDYDVSSLDYSESEESEESESMSGRNIETIYSRSTGVWNLTITNLQPVNLPTVRNFLHATRGNAEFTFDPYGTIAVPAEPVTVITKANFKEQRSGNSDYFSISQQFRIVNL